MRRVARQSHLLPVATLPAWEHIENMSKRSSKPATMTLKNFTVVSVPERENNDGTVTPTTYHIMSLHTHRCVATAASFQQACEWVGDFNVGIDPRDAK